MLAASASSVLSKDKLERSTIFRSPLGYRQRLPTSISAVTHLCCMEPPQQMGNGGNLGNCPARGCTTESLVNRAPSFA